MAETGILHEDDRVELLEGEVCAMSPVGSLHAACVNRISRYLIERTGNQAVVSEQNPVRLNDHSEPQPDICVARYREDFYASEHPSPDDILLLIEVADTSMSYDRDIKLPVYARSKISEVWIVNLPEQSALCYGKPENGYYQIMKEYGKGAVLTPVLLPLLNVPFNVLSGSR
jgi:Uma2 family endonuclease